MEAGYILGFDKKLRNIKEKWEISYCERNDTLIKKNSKSLNRTTKTTTNKFAL